MFFPRKHQLQPENDTLRPLSVIARTLTFLCCLAIVAANWPSPLPCILCGGLAIGLYLTRKD